MDFYSPIKDLFGFFFPPVQDKLINSRWLETSELVQKLENQGYKVYQFKLDRVEERKLDGWQVYHFREGRKRFRLLNGSNVLMVKKSG